MEKELFIDQDLRTLQKKMKDNKSSENLVMRSGNHGKYAEIKDIITKGSPKTSEKTAEKIAAEKTSEKIASEKKLEVVSTELLQTLFGVKPQIKSNNNRLF